MDTGTKKKLIIGGGILAVFGAWWLYKKGSAIQNLSILVQDIAVLFKSTAFQINLSLIVNNSSNEVLKFLSFTGNVFSDSQVIGTIDIAKPVTIAAKSVTTVPLTASVPLTNIASSLLSMFAQKKMATEGILKGTVTLSGGISIPVYYAFAFGSPEAPTAANTAIPTKVTTKPLTPTQKPGTVVKSAGTTTQVTELQKQLAATKKAIADKKVSAKLSKQNARAAKKLKKLTSI